jgi:ParB family chromosome partitioning protein
MIEKKRGLGRSLGDLLGANQWLQKNDVQLFYCPLDQLYPSPYQPRRMADDVHLEELAQSISRKGVLQPILVTRGDDPDRYQILAGERRWQAARKAGLSEVPVILRETTSPEALEIALIENIQRRDLNCIEEALAYFRLQDEFHLTQEEIAGRVGKDRSTVANLLRLLQLPPEIQEDVLNERLTMGHARALLGVSDPGELRKARDLVLARGLSVRQTEQLVSSGLPARTPKPPLDPGLKGIQESLSRFLDTRVQLRKRGKKGSITISFASDDQLEELLKRLGLSA